jgi:hypothetical protein
MATSLTLGDLTKLWAVLMTQRTITLELKVNYSNDEEKNALMEKKIVKAAKQILYAATLISDKRKPDIAVFTKDNFYGKRDIELWSEEDDAG